MYLPPAECCCGVAIVIIYMTFLCPGLVLKNVLLIRKNDFTDKFLLFSHKAGGFICSDAGLFLCSHHPIPSLIFAWGYCTIHR